MRKSVLLESLDELWDDLAVTPEAIPVHDLQAQEVARRETNLSNNPAWGLSWKEVKRRVRSNYGR